MSLEQHPWRWGVTHLSRRVPGKKEGLECGLHSECCGHQLSSLQSLAWPPPCRGSPLRAHRNEGSALSRLPPPHPGTLPERPGSPVPTPRWSDTGKASRGPRPLTGEWPPGVWEGPSFKAKQKVRVCAPKAAAAVCYSEVRSVRPLLINVLLGDDGVSGTAGAGRQVSHIPLLPFQP